MMLALMIEFHQSLWVTPAEIMVELDKLAGEIRDWAADQTTWGTSDEAAAANAAAMARAGGPAPMRTPEPSD